MNTTYICLSSTVIGIISFVIFSYGFAKHMQEKIAGDPDLSDSEREESLTFLRKWKFAAPIGLLLFMGVFAYGTLFEPPEAPHQHKKGV